MQLFIDLVTISAILISFSFFYGNISGFLRFRSLIKTEIIQGILFSLIGIIGMLIPVELAPGVIMDGRTIIVAISVIFGGIKSGIITTISIASYRWILGGYGMLPGVLAIFLGLFVGIAFRSFLGSDISGYKSYKFIPMGTISAVLGLGTALLLPDWEIAKQVFRKALIPINLFYPSISFLLGYLLTRENNRFQTRISLQESEEKYRTMMESIDEPIYICSHDFHVEYMNPAMIRRTGYDAKGEICHKVIHGLEENCSWCPFDNVKRGKSHSYEIVSPKDNRTYHISNSPVYRKDRSISKLTIYRDITDIKNMEMQLQQAHKMESIGILAGGIAHDFNNILSGIMSAAQLLELPNRNLDDKGMKYVNMILESSKRAGKLIDRLLTFSRKSKITVEQLDLHNVLDESVEILKRTIDKKKTIGLLKGARSSRILGDHSMIENIVMNLCINASHAIENKGSIRIITEDFYADNSYCQSSVFSIDPGGYCRLSIIDDGAGISPEDINHIFEPFFTTKEYGKGTGLGLSTVFGAVQNLKGEITVQSELGTGTSFIMLLPCAMSTTDVDAVEERKVLGLGTILLVDDDEIYRILNKDILESLGYEVIMAEDGIKAVNIFENRYSEIDIVLMDMIMPEMNGSEAFFKMKEIDENCRIIITSGYTKDENMKDLLDSGLLGFLNKPFGLSEISQLLNSSLISKK